MKVNSILLIIISANLVACNDSGNTVSSEIISKQEIARIDTNINKLYPDADSKLKQHILNVAVESLESMVFIKGGTFMMGDFKAPCSPLDLKRMDWTPEASCNTALSMTRTGANYQHKVTLSNYSLSDHETTYYETDAFNRSENKPVANQDSRYDKEFPIQDEQLKNRPSSTKSWQEAKDYCLWLGKLTNYPIDLPTEAQWEYAARNRGKNIYFATNNGYIQQIGSRYVDKDGSIHEYTKEQGNYGDFGDIKRWPPNPLGLYDMAGNAGEWVNDWYSKDYYKVSPELNPQGPKTGTEKVTRGWGDSMPLTTTRSHEKPIDSMYYSRRGFRCAVQQNNPINQK
ncbi:formylglycine-generating enzyme family protein [Photobacterium damselae subsp. damselae]|uniref:formylglycine-generating enzyme family protein n=1 Tax=Photobacterium damselae TaxID=38293 RepID=UPI001F35427F|nr:SUMF1/EgtB/PvdO family nonheme iron enzyme [Photobacterium damselae]UJZ96112.1 formylglycine-generating enzyme family protein [Photobacterium damselae subsp. damselae]UJZ99983.1 formylglycine-generating enzyme family protein [Photobacterium damselae subsp. damselae]